VVDALVIRDLAQTLSSLRPRADLQLFLSKFDVDVMAFWSLCGARWWPLPPRR